MSSSEKLNLRSAQKRGTPRATLKVPQNMQSPPRESTIRQRHSSRPKALSKVVTDRLYPMSLAAQTESLEKLWQRTKYGSAGKPKPTKSLQVQVHSSLQRQIQARMAEIAKQSEQPGQTKTLAKKSSSTSRRKVSAILPPSGSPKKKAKSRKTNNCKLLSSSSKKLAKSLSPNAAESGNRIIREETPLVASNDNDLTLTLENQDLSQQLFQINGQNIIPKAKHAKKQAHAQIRAQVEEQKRYQSLEDAVAQIELKKISIDGVPLSQESDSNRGLQRMMPMKSCLKSSSRRDSKGSSSLQFKGDKQSFEPLEAVRSQNDFREAWIQQLGSSGPMTITDQQWQQRASAGITVRPLEDENKTEDVLTNIELPTVAGMTGSRSCKQHCKQEQKQPQKFDMTNFYMKRQGNDFYQYVDATVNGTDERIACTKTFKISGGQSVDPVLLSSQNTSNAQSATDKRMTLRDLDSSQCQQSIKSMLIQPVHKSSPVRNRLSIDDSKPSMKPEANSLTSGYFLCSEKLQAPTSKTALDSQQAQDTAQSHALTARSQQQPAPGKDGEKKQSGGWCQRVQSARHQDGIYSNLAINQNMPQAVNCARLSSQTSSLGPNTLPAEHDYKLQRSLFKSVHGSRTSVTSYFNQAVGLERTRAQNASNTSLFANINTIDQKTGPAKKSLVPALILHQQTDLGQADLDSEDVREPYLNQDLQQLSAAVSLTDRPSHLGQREYGKSAEDLGSQRASQPTLSNKKSPMACHMTRPQAITSTAQSREKRKEKLIHLKSQDRPDKAATRLRSLLISSPVLESKLALQDRTYSNRKELITPCKEQNRQMAAVGVDCEEDFDDQRADVNRDEEIAPSLEHHQRIDYSFGAKPQVPLESLSNKCRLETEFQEIGDDAVTPQSLFIDMLSDREEELNQIDNAKVFLSVTPKGSFRNHQFIKDSQHVKLQQKSFQVQRGDLSSRDHLHNRQSLLCNNNKASSTDTGTAQYGVNYQANQRRGRVAQKSTRSNMTIISTSNRESQRTERLMQPATQTIQQKAALLTVSNSRRLQEANVPREGFSSSRGPPKRQYPQQIKPVLSRNNPNLSSVHAPTEQSDPSRSRKYQSQQNSLTGPIRDMAAVQNTVVEQHRNVQRQASRESSSQERHNQMGFITSMKQLNKQVEQSAKRKLDYEEQYHN